MNDSIKNIINLTSKLTAQSVAMEKISNAVNIHAKYCKTSDVFNKVDSWDSSVLNATNLFSKYESASKIVDIHSLNPCTEVQSNGVASAMSNLQAFIRSQKQFDKINNPFYLSITPKYTEINNLNNWNHFVPKLDNLKFPSNYENLEYYETLQSFAQYDISKNRILKDKISQRVEDVLYGRRSYDEDYFYQPAHDFTFRQQSLENLKNYIINGNFDFKYTIGLEDFLWTHFTRIEELEDTIHHTAFELRFLNKVIISISNCLKKNALNKRDFFRKINSFHFKNLDDYDSFSLVA